MVAAKQKTSVTIRNYQNFMNFDWEEICAELRQVMRLPNEESEKIKNHHTAQLIAYIPYLAGCKDYKRIALAKLCIYIIASRTPWAKHTLDETILHRIAMLTCFPGGNKDVKQAGLMLLGLISINDHKRDLEDDISKQLSNPLIFMSEAVVQKMEKQLWKRFEMLTAGRDFDFGFFRKFVNFSWWM